METAAALSKRAARGESVNGNGANAGALVLDSVDATVRHVVSHVLAHVVQAAEYEVARERTQASARNGNQPTAGATSERAERARYSFD